MLNEAPPSPPPLVEGRALSFSALRQDGPQSFSCDEGNIYLHGMGGLVDAIIDPKRHLHGGAFFYEGRPIEEALRHGRLAICPSHLPVPPTTRLFDALITSARLLGRGGSDVRRSLEQVSLEAEGKSALGQLSPESHRRAGIAHGLITLPETLIFARPFHNLTDREKRDMSRLMERVVTDRNWMVAGEASCSVSQSWRAKAKWIMSLDGEQRIVVRTSPEEPKSYFLRLSKTPAGLSAELKDRGATVTPSENPRVLLVSGLRAHEISEISDMFSDSTVVSLEAAEEHGFRHSHARSAL